MDMYMMGYWLNTYRDYRDTFSNEFESAKAHLAQYAPMYDVSQVTEQIISSVNCGDDSKKVSSVLELLPNKDGFHEKVLIYNYEIVNENGQVAHQSVFEFYSTKTSVESGIPTKICSGAFPTQSMIEESGDCTSAFLVEVNDPTERMSHEWLLDFDIEPYKNQDTAE